METKVKPAVETWLCRGYLFLMLALLPLAVHNGFFDITETTFVSAFVCEVQLTALSGAVRSFSFDTHQRPCSRADVNEIIIVSRYCKYRRTCIMCCRCNYF